MYLDRPELLLKLNSLVNRYGGDEAFVSHMDEWPRTVKELILNSDELMARFKLMEPIPDPFNHKTVVNGME